jgi:hypothetical protein
MISVRIIFFELVIEDNVRLVLFSLFQISKISFG